MSILYLLTVFDGKKEILRQYGHKTIIIKTVNEIMQNINKDISINIETAQK